MKKEKTFRVLTLVLCLCLCGALLCGCGDKADSLWGKTVRVETEPIPAEALDGEDSRCCGVSPDGSKLLIAGGGHSYLWDRESGERLSLTPGDEATETRLRELLAEQAKEEQTETLPAEELVDAVFPGSIFEALPSHGEGNWLLVSFSSIAYEPFALDTDSGKLYWNYQSACGDELLRWSFEDVQIYSRKTGNTRIEDFSAHSGKDSFIDFSGAFFLPDGSCCAVIRDKNETKLVIHPSRGEEEVYLLGQARFSDYPQNFYAVGSDYLLLAEVRKTPYPILLIDRKSGTVSLLTEENRRVRVIPQEEAMEPDGSWRTEYREHRVLPLQSMADGETILLYAVHSKDLLLFRPKTGEAQQIVIPEEIQIHRWPGNGCDLMLQVTTQELIRFRTD